LYLLGGIGPGGISLGRIDPGGCQIDSAEGGYHLGGGAEKPSGGGGAPVAHQKGSGRPKGKVCKGTTGKDKGVPLGKRGAGGDGGGRTCIYGHSTGRSRAKGGPKAVADKGRSLEIANKKGRKRDNQQTTGGGRRYLNQSVRIRRRKKIKIFFYSLKNGGARYSGEKNRS